jgi:hypothetical protein
VVAAVFLVLLFIASLRLCALGIWIAAAVAVLVLLALLLKGPAAAPGVPAAGGPAAPAPAQPAWPAAVLRQVDRRYSGGRGGNRLRRGFPGRGSVFRGGYVFFFTCRHGLHLQADSSCGLRRLQNQLKKGAMISHCAYISIVAEGDG